MTIPNLQWQQNLAFLWVLPNRLQAIAELSQRQCHELSSLIEDMDVSVYRSEVTMQRARFITTVIQHLSQYNKGAIGDNSEQRPSWLQDHLHQCEGDVACRLEVADLRFLRGKSAAYLAPSFKKYLGASPSVWLDEAARLLRRCDDGVLSVSLQVWFVNLSYFINYFANDFL